MSIFDIAVLSVVGVSMLVGLTRGAVREVFAIAGWVAAFLLARWLASDVALLLPDAIPSQGLRHLAAFIIALVSVLLLATLIGVALSSVIRGLGLGALDRGLGLAFGLARGLLIVLMFVLAAGLTNLPRQTFWQNAMLSAPLEAVGRRLADFLPEAYAKRIRYGGEPQSLSKQWAPASFARDQSGRRFKPPCSMLDRSYI